MSVSAQPAREERSALRSLSEAPAVVPALAALALFILWATDRAGYPVTHWGPGALFVLGLLGISLVAIGVRPREIPRPVLLALGCLAAYTALSYLSILWASVPGDAWEGANRTLLYLLVFALFACWRQTGRTAVLLVGAWTIAMIVLAAFAAFHVRGASGAALTGMLPGGRLDYPSGYPNANAAQWLMAFWPALLLARTRELPAALRGLFAGGAVLLADAALLSQSRGSLFATPVMLILVFALLPARMRTLAVLIPVSIAIAATAKPVLHVGDHLVRGAVTASAVHAAVDASLAAAVVVGLLVAAGAVIESRLRIGEPTSRRLQRGARVAAAIALVLVLVGGLAAAGNPVTRVRHAWDSFKGGYSSTSTGSRLVSGLGSNRYDFYRVALDEFAAHPIAGIGADNFQQAYLARGRSAETPRYPHSVELRTLTETGLIGALIALVGLGGALLAGARALRGPDPLARAAAAAALGGFAYWAVHGSFDWFWEFAGLGAPAIALLGLSCSLCPRPAAATAAIRAPRGRAPRVLAIGAAVLVGVAAALSLGAPWLSQVQLESAAGVWTRSPGTAYGRLARAADLNPLSDQANLLAGSIALRYGDYARADHQFALALQRSPDDAYATLERGAIASSRGQRALALALLGRAVALNPRDPVAAGALRAARRGERVSVQELNRAILIRAQQIA